MEPLSSYKPLKSAERTIILTTRRERRTSPIGYS